MQQITLLLNLIPVCVEFDSGNPPTKKQIEDLEGQCEGIPLKICYVEHGCVSFFSFNAIELPLLPCFISIFIVTKYKH